MLQAMWLGEITIRHRQAIIHAAVIDLDENQPSAPSTFALWLEEIPGILTI
jgi:hypothetical protein